MGTVEAICQILIGSINNVDIPIWIPTAKGEFIVRSAYHLHKEILESNKGECSRIEQQMLWKQIWWMNKHNVVKVFLWRARHNALATKLISFVERSPRILYAQISGLSISLQGMFCGVVLLHR